MGKTRKPKDVSLYDGLGECLSADKHFNAAAGIQLEAFLYTAKDTRKLIRWLKRAEKWLAERESV